jgi:exo-beta-1,3-glucanase (GH17 family)
MFNLTCVDAKNNVNQTAKSLLENKTTKAICYGGYRTTSRDNQPTIPQIKEDLKILNALGFKFIRMYNVHLAETENVLKAITEIQKENQSFEMYLMLGAWIDCKNAWTSETPIHNQESNRNPTEIDEAVRLANSYPDIVKVISVGNEAMINWAVSYYVEPFIILKWVEHLQDLKKNNKLSKDIWITSSDNFAAWGGEPKYHNDTLAKLCRAVDYISMHTYPFHDTRHNPETWGVEKLEKNLSKKEQVEKLMQRALVASQNQYKAVADYVKSLDINKPIHIGETGWSTKSDDYYGTEGSRAADEYKQALFYNKMKQWCLNEKITFFYFEAFDEIWKDANSPNHCENHFGLFTIVGKAKYAVWDEVNKGKLQKLKRDGKSIVKTYNGNENLVLKDVEIKFSTKN